MSATPLPAPTHHGFLTPHSTDPVCAGPDVDRLVESFLTPTPLHFVRTHGPVPQVDVDAYRLRIDGLVGRPVGLDLADLHSRFAQHSVTATLQCAGNRRQELHAFRPFENEVLWGGCAVGTATWRGPRLVDLLVEAGIHARTSDVWFEGLDRAVVDGQPTPFGGSIAVARAVRPDVLVATEMNGRPLTADHGAPARLVVPGFIGARSVKWLGRVTLADRPSDNPFEASKYRIVDAERGVAGPAIETAPLNSFFGSVADGDEVPAGRIRLAGYATPTGTEQVTAVEVAIDGDDWRSAELLDPPEPATWVRWELRVDLAPGPHTLHVRAHDTSGASQPLDMRTTWNARGYLNNAVQTLQVVARGSEAALAVGGLRAHQPAG